MFKMPRIDQYDIMRTYIVMLAKSFITFNLQWMLWMVIKDVLQEASVIDPRKKIAPPYDTMCRLLEDNGKITSYFSYS